MSIFLGIERSYYRCGEECQGGHKWAAWEVKGREANRRENQTGRGGREVRVTVFRNHPPWQAGYVADVTDLRVEEAGFPPDSFVHSILIEIRPDSRV